MDAVFIVVLVLGALRGLFTGRLLPLLIVFAIWITSIALAVNFEDQLGSTFGDYHWYPLLAFFIILIVIQAIIYWSGIPIMILNSIKWRPLRSMNMLGSALLSACITAIYCGLAWRVLWEIARAVAQTSGFTAEGTGAASTYYNLIEGSALRSGFIAFVDWYEPPLGVVLGSIVLAALVGLAVAGRLRGDESEVESEDDDESGIGGGETGSGTDTLSH